MARGFKTQVQPYGSQIAPKRKTTNVPFRKAKLMATKVAPALLSVGAKKVKKAVKKVVKGAKK